MIDQDRRGIDGRNFSLSVKQYAKSFPSLYDILYIGVCCGSMAFITTNQAGANYWSGEASFLFVFVIGLVCIGCWYKYSRIFEVN